MQGRGVYTWSDGTRYEGDLSDGKPNGYGVVVWLSGTRYQGEVRNGHLNGHGIKTWSGGAYYDGEWLDDKRNGHGVFISANGKRREGEWRDDKLIALAPASSPPTGSVADPAPRPAPAPPTRPVPVTPLPIETGPSEADTIQFILAHVSGKFQQTPDGGYIRQNMEITAIDTYGNLVVRYEADSRFPSLRLNDKDVYVFLIRLMALAPNAILLKGDPTSVEVQCRIPNCITRRGGSPDPWYINTFSFWTSSVEAPRIAIALSHLISVRGGVREPFK